MTENLRGIKTIIEEGRGAHGYELSMALGSDKEKLVVTVTKEMKQQIAALAAKDNRNVSNYVYNILLKHIDENIDEVESSQE